MKICWVTNDKYYSKLLRFLFSEETSHVGATFKVDGIELAVDLNRPYGKVWSLKRWLNKYRVVYEVEIPLKKSEEMDMYKTVHDYCELREYDFTAYKYGMWLGILYKLFNKPLPKTNKYSSTTKSMCQEVITPVVQHDIIKSKGLNVDYYASLPDITAMTPDMSMKYFNNLTKGNPNFKWYYNG